MSTYSAVAEAPVAQARPAVPWRAIVGIALIALAHVPILITYLSGLLDLPHYGFVLLLPIGSVVLAWPRLFILGQLTPGRAVGFVSWVSVALLVLSAAVVLESPWLGAISSLFALAAVIHAYGGGRLMFALLPAWGLLWLGIRLPLTADEKLAQALQRIAAVRAGGVLDLTGTMHLRDGNVIEAIAGDGNAKRYMVEEACSGVQSLFAIIACTIFFALWMRESWWRTVLLLAVALWWVWVTNVFRVFLVTFLDSQWGIPVDAGWRHDALSVALFVVTLGLIVSSEHLILFFLPRGIFTRNPDLAVKHDQGPRDYGPTKFPSLSKTLLASTAVPIVYAVVIFGQWLPQWRVPKATATPMKLGTLGREFAPPTFAGVADLPELEGWTLRDDGFKSETRRSDSQWGAKSQTWHYEKDGRQMVVSLDYPFRGWHELTICYEADGWLPQQRDVVDVPRRAGFEQLVKPGEKCVTAAFHRPEIGDYGFLVFESFNDRQDAIPPPTRRGLVQKLTDRLDAFVERMRTLGASGNGLNDQAPSYQLQVFLQDHAAPTDADRVAALKLFSVFRARLGEALPPVEGGAAR